MKLHLKVNDRLVLKHASIADILPLYDLILQNRAYLSAYLGWVNHVHFIGDMIKMLESWQYVTVYDTDFPLMVWYDNELVGVVGFNNGDAHKKTVNIGYWIAEAFAGKSIMKQSTKTLIDFAFSMTNIEEIRIKTEINHVRSFMIAINLGFTQETDYVERVLVNDAPHELHSFVLRRKDI